MKKASTILRKRYGIKKKSKQPKALKKYDKRHFISGLRMAIGVLQLTLGYYDNEG